MLSDHNEKYSDRMERSYKGFAVTFELRFPFPLKIINSLAPEGFDYSLKLANFKLISMINILSIFCEIAISWMPQDLTDYLLTLVQVMAWCRQATSHYMSQCWPRSLSPYDITRPQWLWWYMYFAAEDIILHSKGVFRYLLSHMLLTHNKMYTIWSRGRCRIKYSPPWNFHPGVNIS